MKFKTIPYSFIAVTALVSGCANQQDVVLLENQDDKSLEQLIHTTRDMQRQWGVTSRLSSLKVEDENPTLDISRLEESMRRVVAFPGGYQGTLEDLVVEMSSLSGYDYIKPAGRPPVRGIPVLFDEEYRTIGEYIYDAGIQSGSRATVVMDMKSHSFQIIYTGY